MIRASRLCLSRRASTYVVVPSASRPKLLVPTRPRRVTAAAIRNFKTASSARERALIGALAASARIGLVDLLPDRLRVVPGGSDPPAGIDGHLSVVLGRQVWVSLYVSRARAVRKPLLQVIDAAGRTCAFAKLGVDPFTRALVRAEGEAVRILSLHEWDTLRMPTVLHAGRWHGHELLVQGAFSRGVAPRENSPELRRAMREVACVHGIVSAPLGISSYWEHVLGRIAALPGGEYQPLILRLAAAIERIGGRTDLAFGSSHGDWAPWNMTTTGGQLLAWDWEKFETDVPVGFDAVHFSIQGAVVLSGTAPAAAFAAALRNAEQLLAGLSSRSDAGELVVLLYGLHIALRYIEDGELSAGAGRMSRLATWLPDLLGMAQGR